jgi:hypothetical protein
MKIQAALIALALPCESIPIVAQIQTVTGDGCEPESIPPTGPTTDVLTSEVVPVPTAYASVSTAACFSTSVSTPTWASVVKELVPVAGDVRCNVLTALNCAGFALAASEVKLYEVAHVLVDCIGKSPASVDVDARCFSLPSDVATTDTVTAVAGGKSDTDEGKASHC